MNRMLKLKGLLIFGTSVAETDEGWATDQVVGALFEELGCQTIREAQTLLKVVYEQDALLNACCSYIGDLVLKRLHKGISSNLDKFSPGGIYVFDADKYFNFAKDTVDPETILHTIMLMGDGTLVSVESARHAMCKGRPVQPAYCRRIV